MAGGVVVIEIVDDEAFDLARVQIVAPFKGTRVRHSITRPTSMIQRRVAALSECPEITSVALHCRTRHQ